jgi:hypothetical protein
MLQSYDQECKGSLLGPSALPGDAVPESVGVLARVRNQTERR